MNISLSLAPNGSVFQPNGKNCQREEDVISDTIYATGCNRPEIGECVANTFLYVKSL